MKRCPLCRSGYPAENDFCPDDGSELINDESPSNIPTVFLTMASQETRHVPKTAVNISNVGPRLTPQHFLIGVLSLIVLVLAGVLLLRIPRNSDTTVEAEEFALTANKSNHEISPADPSPTRSVQSFFNSNTASLAAGKPRRTPKGTWNGDWSSPSGAYLTMTLSLHDDGMGNLSGQINWTLRRSNRPDKMNKIGLTATEYVSGSFADDTGTLSLRGYRKDDPDNVLVMVDTYRLQLSPDSRRISGSARNGGKWNASVNLAR